MKKSTKGAIAGATAALLLMGGLGTNAAWQSEGTVGGSGISTGVLRLDPNCGSWKFGILNGEVIQNPLDVAHNAVKDLLLIPGDILTRTCTFTVHVEGTHLTAADITITNPTPKILDASSNPVPNIQVVAELLDSDSRAT